MRKEVFVMENFAGKRSAGILMHLSSLPSPYGIGTLGIEAYQFADFLSECGVTIWQMLPLTLTSYGDSPYQSPSSSGLNYYFIDLRILTEKGLLKTEEYESIDFGSDPKRVDYGKLFENRIQVLKLAFSRFDRKKRDFIKFENEGKKRDFAFFMTMKELHDYAPWYEWGEERNYTPELEASIIKNHYDTYLFYVWTQYEFEQEYYQLKKYINGKGIQIVGDMPIYLARDSIEVYKYSDLFLMDEKHNPTVVAGVPPDYFSKDGQLWGNPIYDWKKMKENNYLWFKNRIRENLTLFDILRIDHFRAFADYYTIPFGSETARVGKWELGPGMDLFADLKDLPIIAEDLGDISEIVVDLLRDTGYPGMRVLEFGFDGDPTNIHKATNYPVNCFAYTGTHDNMPLLGHLAGLNEKQIFTLRFDLMKQCYNFDVKYEDDSLQSLVKTIDRLALKSPAKACVLPIQDILVQGAESRMNEPSTLSAKNWSYRTVKEDYTPLLIEELRDAVRKASR